DSDSVNEALTLQASRSLCLVNVSLSSEPRCCCDNKKHSCSMFSPFQDVSWRKHVSASDCIADSVTRSVSPYFFFLNSYTDLSSRVGHVLECLRMGCTEGNLHVG